MSIEQNKSIALRFVKEGWGTATNWDTVWDELVAPDIVYHFCGWIEPIRGLEDTKKLQTTLFEGFPDMEKTIEDVIAENSQVVIRSKLKGTHKGNFLGVPPKNKLITITDLSLFRIEDKIVEVWYELNQMEVMRQIGAISL